MKTREEMVELFSRFMKDNTLSATDLLYIIEFSARELGGRKAISFDVVREIVRLVYEEM